MTTNITIFKSPKYSCFHICNIDDAKIIDGICTCSKLIFQHGSNKHPNKTEDKKTPHKDRKLKQIESCKDDEITKTNDRRLKTCGSH